MDATREAEELVERWQELQTAQVAGDLGRLDALRRLAEANASRAGASDEWRLLAREAGRHTESLGVERETRPEIAVGAAGGEAADLGDVATPEPAHERADEAGAGRQKLRLGPLVWVLILAGWLILQLIGNVGEGGGP